LDDKVHCRCQVGSSDFSTKSIFWSCTQIDDCDLAGSSTTSKEKFNSCFKNKHYIEVEKYQNKEDKKYLDKEYLSICTS